MSSHNSLNLPTATKMYIEIRRELLSQGVDQYIPYELVVQTRKRLERREFKKCIFSLPKDGVTIVMFINEKKVQDSAWSRFVKWVNSCFVKEDI